MSDNENISIRKRTSLVWQYFEKLSSCRVKCRICHHEQRYMGNTANALRHLKVKHDVDCRSKGLEDPENVKRMQALSGFSSALEQTISAVRSENKLHYSDAKEEDFNGSGRVPKSARNHHYFKEETEVDPYSSENEPLVDLSENRNNCQVENKKRETSPPTNRCANNSSSKERRKTCLEEKRIMAETEYYREKAAYFRIQKHLAALQAKKVKYELEQLYRK